jgi:hypothetical protein
LFTQERVAASAARFLDVLLGNEPRKTGWIRAEAAGDPGPWRQQASSQQHAEKNEISDTKELIFRRAHQAAARRSHLKSKMQL